MGRFQSAVTDGHKGTQEAVAEITYECRDKANAAGQTERFVGGPKAELNDRSSKQVGTYLPIYQFIRSSPESVGA